MINRVENMRIELRERIRGGEGIITCINLLEKNQCFGKVNYCAVFNLEPGQSIGPHPHGPDAEIYYLLKGSLAVTDNGIETFLKEGDVMFTSNGEIHSVKNISDKPAQLLAVVIA